jgi:hypothetical protein
VKLHVDERLADAQVVNAERFDADRKHWSLDVHFVRCVPRESLAAA